VLDKAEYSAFESTLNSLYRIVSIVSKLNRTKPYFHTIGLRKFKQCSTETLLSGYKHLTNYMRQLCHISASDLAYIGS